MNTFQKPLTEEEESYYLGVLQTGGREDAGEAKTILIERNLRLVAHVAKKYAGAGEDMEDLISIGCIGLIKAIESFDRNKGRLATYACRCIDNELLMRFRGRKKYNREISLYEPIGQDKEGNEITLVDVIENEQQDIVDRLEKEDRLKKLNILMESGLSERERTILQLRYGLLDGQEITQNEVGDQLGISRSYVSRIEKKALQKLRAGFERG